MTTENPVFIHLIGLEGCGHHGVFPIFEKILHDKYSASERPLYFRTGLRGMFNAIYYKGLPKDIVFSDMETFLYHNPGAIFVDDNSYPSADYREPQNQWDFSEIYARMQGKCDVRLVQLRRNIFNTINSHRDWDGGLLGHAKVLATIQRSLDEKVALLTGQGVKFHDLDYDNIRNDAATIAEITGCDVTAVEAATTDLFEPSRKDYREQLSEDEIGEISRLFDVSA